MSMVFVVTQTTVPSLRKSSRQSTPAEERGAHCGRPARKRAASLRTTHLSWHRKKEFSVTISSLCSFFECGETACRVRRLVCSRWKHTQDTHTFEFFSQNSQESDFSPLLVTLWAFFEKFKTTLGINSLFDTSGKWSHDTHTLEV